MGLRILAMAAAAYALAAAANAQELPASAFARLPAVEFPALSPDGSRMAQIERNANGTDLVVRSVPDFAPLAVVNAANINARRLLWADDDIVIVIVSEASAVGGFRAQIEFTAPFSVDLADGNRVRQLMRTRQSSDARTIGGTFSPNTGSIVGREPATGRLLIIDFGEEGLSLYSVNPRNDQRKVVGAGLINTSNWVVDENGAPIARVDYQNDRFVVNARRADGWQIVAPETVENPIMDVFGVNALGGLVVGAVVPNTGRFGLYVLSLGTGVIDPYYRDAEYDVVDTVQDPHTNRVVGAIVSAENTNVVWFDDELEARHSEIGQALNGVPGSVVSWSRDRARLIVRVESGRQPTAFYLYDAAPAKLKPIASAYPEAYAAGIAPRYPILYPARDGVQIPAYVTMQDDLPQPAPLVVLPHGGPESRDVGGFDWLAHFLASRGYVVVQPNFRGSEGYGAAWRDAGRGGWGTGVMQHDITDAVRVFIEEGIADPERVCIVGASYGGYAALAGAAFTPELYRCTVAIAPVTDLNAMMADERTYSSPDSWAVQYWRRVIGGDAGLARSRLAAISPADNADRIRAPVLLIHGREDTTVPIDQSRRMESALKRAGKDVELVELRGEDHYLRTAEMRLEALLALERFLAEHLD